MRAHLTGLMVVGLALFGSCSAEKSPARDAAHYALDIVLCAEKATTPAEQCTPPSGSSHTVFAHVVAGNVDGRVVQTETDGPRRGSVRGDELYVRLGATFSEWFEVRRDDWCFELPCTVNFRVYIGYQLVLAEEITFK